MDKPYLDRRSCEMMQQRIQSVIANKGACGIGDSTRDTCCADSCGHISHGDGGKIGGRAMGDDRIAGGLISLVIRNPGVPDIHGDPLRCDGIPANRQAHAQDYIRLKFLRLGKDSLGGFSVYSGDLKFT